MIHREGFILAPERLDAKNTSIRSVLKITTFSVNARNCECLQQKRSAERGFERQSYSSDDFFASCLVLCSDRQANQWSIVKRE